jgi:penicillin-binding protein 1A
MTPAEAALLAGIPEDPSAWDPVAHPRAAKGRRNLVLGLLFQQGYLTRHEYVNSLDFPMPDPESVALPSTQGKFAPYFANYVKDQLVQQYGPKRAFGGGLKVTTTLDTGLQKIAQDAIAKVLPQNGTNPAVALVAIDTQSDPGAIRAMVGGANYHKNQFNLATQGERQPGSSFKPFVLATALKENVSPSSILTSSKEVTINADGRQWQVNNYEGEALGPITLSQAIAYSDNSVFSQLTAIVGPRNVAATAHQLGITSKLEGYFAIGLGAEPATPVEMARAYGSFADGGKRIDGSIFGNQPRAINTIDIDGKRHVNEPVAHDVLSADQAATVNQLLQGVVQYGTGRAAALPGWQVAGKTGTTENYGDAWFVGYLPQMVVAVWVGYPDKLVPMTYEFHGHPVAGGTFPALIWKAFMQQATQYLKLQPESFPAAPSLYASPVTVVNRGGVLQRDDGVCKNTYQLAFYGGEPQRTNGTAAPDANCKPNEVEIPDVVGRSLAYARTRLGGQPLTPAVVYKPAKTGDRVGYVVGQFPRRGTASAYDKITLISEKSLHGVVPRVVGQRVATAKARLARLHMKVSLKGGDTGRVTAQSVPTNTAAEPGLEITLTVKP